MHCVLHFADSQNFICKFMLLKYANLPLFKLSLLAGLAFLNGYFREMLKIFVKLPQTNGQNLHRLILGSNCVVQNRRMRNFSFWAQKSSQKRLPGCFYRVFGMYAGTLCRFCKECALLVHVDKHDLIRFDES